MKRNCEIVQPKGNVVRAVGESDSFAMSVDCCVEIAEQSRAFEPLSPCDPMIIQVFGIWFPRIRFDRLSSRRAGYLAHTC